jgi:hypothetical protein
MQKMTLYEALDDFLQHVEPTLFPDGRRHAKGYSRVRNLVQARRAELEGRKPARPITYDWVKSVLRDFAPDRYVFQETVEIFVRG